MITKEEALSCLEDMDDYARMTMGVDPFGPYNALKEFIEQQKGYDLFGYYWIEEDYDYSDGRMCSGVYFGDPEHVIDGDKMIPLYSLNNETN